MTKSRLAPLASLVNDVEDTCREALERLQVVEERSVCLCHLGSRVEYTSILYHPIFSLCSLFRYRDRDVEDEAREFVKEVGSEVHLDRCPLVPGGRSQGGWQPGGPVPQRPPRQPSRLHDRAEVRQELGSGEDGFPQR